MSTPGKARLRLNSAGGVTAWLDGKPVEVKEAMELDLPAGTRTLALALDAGKRTEGLRLEVEDVPGSPARVRPVGGK